MVARGMPPERILEEHRSQNTGENVIFFAAGDRRGARPRKPEKRDLPRQQLDRAALSDDAAVALAGGREDAGDGGQFCDPPRALAPRSDIPPPRPARVGQDRAVPGEGLYRGVAGRLKAAHYSVESKSSSVALSIPASVRKPRSSCSIGGAASASRTAWARAPVWRRRSSTA